MFVHRSFNRLIVIWLLAIVPLTACVPAAAPEPAKTPLPPTAAPDLKQALVGSWTSTVTKKDILRVVPDFKLEYMCENAGTFIWRFNADGKFTIDQTPLPECPAPANPHVEDTWSIDGNLFTVAKGTPDQEIYEFAINGDQLTFKTKSSECIPCIAINTANPWTRVE